MDQVSYKNSFLLKSYNIPLPSKQHPAKQFHYTGSSLPLLPPALSSPSPKYGPMTGMFLAKPPMVPKKSPNRMKIPYSSITKPKNGHRSKIKLIPTTKAAVPLSLFLRAKKSSVRCGPSRRDVPRRKRI
jgi:hypothetical protein